MAQPGMLPLPGVPAIPPPPVGLPTAAVPPQPQALLLPPAAWQVSLDWTDEEQRALEAAMARFPPDRSGAVERYVKMAAMLPRKSVRDVALRVRWTQQQALLKQRRGVEHLPGGVPGMARPGVPGARGQEGELPPGSATIEGPVGQLLEANFGILNQFRANMASFKVQENTELLVQFRDNILEILSHMESMGGVMAQMPQLPVRLNVDLANNFLPSRAMASLNIGGQMPQPVGPGMVPISGFGAGAGGEPDAPPPPPPGGAGAAPLGHGGGSRQLLSAPSSSALIKQDSAQLPAGYGGMSRVLLKQEKD